MKKIQILILCAICFIMAIAFIVINKNNNTSDSILEKNEDRNLTIELDEVSGTYYLKDEEGEIIQSSKDEEILEVYILNPGYNPRTIQ